MFAFYNLPVHDSTELLPHIISRLQTSVVHEVVVTPLEVGRNPMMQIGVSPKIEYLRVLHVLFECVIDVQQREVVTIDVGKSGLESGVRKRTQHLGLTTTASMVQKAFYFGEGKKQICRTKSSPG